MANGTIGGAGPTGTKTGAPRFKEDASTTGKGKMRPVWMPAAFSLATRYEKEEAWHCERRYLWR